VDELTQGRLRGARPIAVIDIGSNTIRLVVYEGLSRSPTPLFQEKVMCGLGRYLNSTGRLNEETIPFALHALSRFRKLADICGVRERDVNPFATAAVRWAVDGPAFLSRAEEACGTSIRVIENTEEAELAATGVLAGFVSPLGVVGDLGGGSLELIRVNGAKFDEPVSLPLGGLALIDKTQGEKSEAIPIIEAALSELDWLPERKGETFYAVGGTWRAFAKLHMRQTDYALSAIHGYKLDGRKALQVTARLANSPPAALRRLDGIRSGREETLPYGALLLNAIIRKMQPDSVTFSAFGVREGYLFRMIGELERQRDPLLTACEDIAQLRSRSLEHARELIEWTEPIFKTPGPTEPAEEARLRMAACLLSDVGWRAHPDYRGEQSAALIAQSALVGIDHPGRAFLALSVYYRHERKLAGELLPKLAALITRHARKRALVVGLAVRLAHTLSAGMEGVLPQTSLSYGNGKLILELPKRLQALDGDTLRRRLRAVAKELEMGSEVRVTQKIETSRPSLFRALMGKTSEDAL